MRKVSQPAEVPAYDIINTAETADSKVVLAGFGRFGQIISKNIAYATYPLYRH